ncbi:MAG: tRNA 2-thiocytidine(32) synthetase TtcA [Flavobacteriales bacterium]|nr:tRNA 2-thiocytidine(32) synthetase TtcA [Flavobacteriales bacterium]
MLKTESTVDLGKLTKKLRREVWRAITDFKMLENGDKIMVCLSGGKDSYTMLDVMMHYQQTSDIDFEIIAVNMDQKQPGFPEEVLPNYLTKLGVPYQIVSQDTYSVVKEKTPEGKATCSLCSRMRRGKLYATAAELGCNKLALGHHRDDIIETFLLNVFFGGKLEAMPPKYRTDDEQFVVIRPLAYCKEEDIEVFADEMQYPIIPCNLCGTQPNLQRQNMKKMLKDWEQIYPDRSAVIFNALKNASPSHLLDPKLFDFTAI